MEGEGTQVTNTEGGDGGGPATSSSPPPSKPSAIIRPPPALSSSSTGGGEEAEVSAADHHHPTAATVGNDSTDHHNETSSPMEQHQAELQAIMEGTHAGYLQKVAHLAELQRKKLWSIEKWRQYSQENVLHVFQAQLQQAEEEYGHAIDVLQDKLKLRLRKKQKMVEEQWWLYRARKWRRMGCKGAPPKRPCFSLSSAGAEGASGATLVGMGARHKIKKEQGEEEEAADGMEVVREREAGAEEEEGTAHDAAAKHLPNGVQSGGGRGGEAEEEEEEEEEEDRRLEKRRKVTGTGATVATPLLKVNYTIEEQEVDEDLAFLERHNAVHTLDKDTREKLFAEANASFHSPSSPSSSSSPSTTSSPAFKSNDTAASAIMTSWKEEEEQLRSSPLQATHRIQDTNNSSASASSQQALAPSQPQSNGGRGLVAHFYGAHAQPNGKQREKGEPVALTPEGTFGRRSFTTTGTLKTNETLDVNGLENDAGGGNSTAQKHIYT